MATKQSTLDNIEHNYSKLKTEYENGDVHTRLALDGPLNYLEDIILEAIGDGWSKRKDQADRLSKELTKTTGEIKKLKAAIDTLVKQALLAAQVLKTLVAIGAVL